MKNLESLLAAERRTRSEEEERVNNLTRLNGMLLMQVGNGVVFISRTSTMTTAVATITMKKKTTKSSTETTMKTTPRIWHKVGTEKS